MKGTFHHSAHCALRLSLTLGEAMNIVTDADRQVASKEVASRGVGRRPPPIPQVVSVAIDPNNNDTAIVTYNRAVTLLPGRFPLQVWQRDAANPGGWIEIEQNDHDGNKPVRQLSPTQIAVDFTLFGNGLENCAYNISGFSGMFPGQ